MGRKAIFIGLAVLVALALVPAGASAAVKPLTEERATVLATKLARLVAKDRDARYARVQRLVKKRTNRFVFEYLERLRDDRVCRAPIVVEQRGNVRRAFLEGGRCGAMRPDALAFEDAIADAIAAVVPKVPQIRSANEDFERRLESCEALNYPREYRADVFRLFELGTEVTSYSPVGSELDAHANRVAAIDTDDASLHAARFAWPKVLDALALVPEIARDPCPPLREWRRNGYSPSEAPVDFEQVRSVHRSFIKYEKRLLGSADRLYRLGVSERIFGAFTPYGLLVAAAVEYDKQN